MKSRSILLAIALFLGSAIKAQSVGIGTTTPNANAALEIKSTNKGVLMPRLSTTARNSMTNVAKGMLVYDTTNAGFYYHDGGKWLPISQSNSDSSLRDTYPGFAPVNATIPINGVLGVSGLYGTLYDNGGAAGNYASNSNGGYSIYFTDDTTALIKVEVVEMNLESPYDSLEIYSTNDYGHKQLFTGNRTGTFYFNGGDALEFKFRSNGVNNLSGFKINWTKLTPNSLKAEAPPLTGWYFNSGKIAARGGVNVNNNWATDSLGMYSFAFGQNATAKGRSSLAFGKNAAATGVASTAIGDNAVATGYGSTAIGGNAEATASSSIAIGSSSAATEYGSLALGQQNIASGLLSTAIGEANVAQASGTFALGTRNILSDIYSTAIGYQNNVNGVLSGAFGSSLVIKEDRSYAIGLNNDTTGTNKLFQIGSGSTINSRSNALTILKNGNTGIGTISPTTTLDVDGGFRTKYSGSVIKSVTGTGNAALVNLTIPALPAGWDFTNTLVMVSAADGISGIIYQTKLTSTTNIQLLFDANAIGPTRFNYIVFKL